MKSGDLVLFLFNLIVQDFILFFNFRQFHHLCLQLTIVRLYSLTLLQKLGLLTERALIVSQLLLQSSDLCRMLFLFCFCSLIVFSGRSCAIDAMLRNLCVQVSGLGLEFSFQFCELFLELFVLDLAFAQFDQSLRHALFNVLSVFNDQFDVFIYIFLSFFEFIKLPLQVFILFPGFSGLCPSLLKFDLQVLRL